MLSADSCIVYSSGHKGFVISFDGTTEYTLELVSQAKLLVPDEPTSADALRAYQASRHAQGNPPDGPGRGASTVLPREPSMVGTVSAGGSRVGKRTSQKGRRGS